MTFLAATGRAFLNFLGIVGRLAMFTPLALSHRVRPPFCPRLIGRQTIDIGYYSLPVVGLTAIFTGMVLALQSHTGFSRIAMIYESKIIWSGAVEEIDRSANPYVEQFIHGRAEGPIQMEIDPAAGEDAANRGSTVV